MKLEKKHWIIIGVVVAIIAVWYFFLRKKKAESNYRMVRRGRRTVGPAVGVVTPTGIGIVSEQITPVYKNKLDFMAAKTPTCPPGCKFVPLSGSGCVCPEDVGSDKPLSPL